MTKDDKKDLFLSILQSWFDDNSEQINFDNCIGFYHYFIDCIDFELKFCIEINSEFHVFLETIIDILSKFNNFHPGEITSKNGLKSIISNYNNSISLNDFDQMLQRLSQIFYMVKDEYLL